MYSGNGGIKHIPSWSKYTNDLGHGLWVLLVSVCVWEKIYTRLRDQQGISNSSIDHGMHYVPKKGKPIPSMSCPALCTDYQCLGNAVQLKNQPGHYNTYIILHYCRDWFVVGIDVFGALGLFFLHSNPLNFREIHQGPRSQQKQQRPATS